MKLISIMRTLFILVLTVGILGGGAYFVAHLKPSTVMAFGNLLVDFHVPTNAPIYTISNLAPGDTIPDKNIDVTNNGTTGQLIAVKGVRTSGVGDNPNLDTGLFISIWEGANVLYGANDSKTLADFFTDSSTGDGVQLNAIAAGGHKTYTFKVIFPSSAGNEYQAKSVTFDLTFGAITSDHVLVNEVFYNVDAAHGSESPKERGVLGVSGNNVTLSITGNGTGSNNTITVTVPKSTACSLLQSNTTIVGSTITAISNTGGNKANKNTKSTVTINTGNSSSNVTIVTQGSRNISNSACGKMLGLDDEWIELFNPTTHDISLKNYTITDNSGNTVKIHANKIIKSQGFALLSKDASTWTHWNENHAAVKVPLGSIIGDGLDDTGDRVILRDPANDISDTMSWGTDTGAFNPSAPAVAAGHSDERNVPGVDTDTAADWHDQLPPTPGS